jgi:predicted  nucleic acid-binding Zn-ribbon protein
MADKSEGRGAGHAMFGLNDPEPRRAAPQDPAQAPPVAPAGPPQYVYVQAPPPANTSGAATGIVVPVLIALLVILTGINLYLEISTRRQLADTQSKQDDQLNLLTRRLDSSDQRYAQLKGEFQVTSEKLGLTQAELGRAKALTSSIEKQEQAAVQQLNQAIAQKASADELNKAQQDANTKIGGLSDALAGTKKDLAAARDEFSGALAGTKGELTGAIARTHDELVALAHRGDRDYFEFNVHSKKGGQKLGGVTIQLVKANAKKNTYTVNLQFDDAPHPTKEHTTNEPIYFYTQGAPSALELVVNKIAKDSITGYLSTPKGLFAGSPNVLNARPGV